ncbi:dCTP deaminase [Methanospirillum lacunae]|uniref:dCTP deaminase n=1 Tax=Methanospirillum lacunae TaxID=668570 RepID=A0A2V2MXM6_9EURY|nr:dCTP deaminase [Methanospirillum lacunae]PWR71035.1 dCTP deaminase [Methanospirillum lacunae]
MILSSRSLRQRLGVPAGNGGVVLEPYGSECQQPASYDLRASEEYSLERGMMTLVATMEWVELPGDLAATLRCRSSYARRGLLISGGFVDPGFRGHLTLCLVNMGPEPVSIKAGDRIVQMIFSEVSAGDEIYNGRYQDSNGVVPAR